jgi:PPOX class probable F420-dependent enzyme
LDRLADERFALLTTFRKDGQTVPTPVGTARDGSELLVWTSANSGKVKRIRRDGTVEIAPSDSRGTPTGDSVRGTHGYLTRPISSTLGP